MNQLNPDPQGGESNMIDDGTCYRCSKSKWHDGQCDESEVLAMRIRCLHCEYSTNAADSPEKQEEDIMQHVAQGHPEGATTQPTPAYETMGPLNARDQSAVNAGCNCSRKMPYYDWTHDPSCPLFASLKSYPPKVSQPVPSAGSKPQEEGGTPAQVDAAGRELPPHCEFCGQWMFRKEVQVRYEANKASFSQPVADGGGLVEGSTDDALMASVRGFANGDKEGCATRDNIRALVNAHASSQEALRVARESALRLIPAIKHIQGLGNDEEIPGEIMLALENLLKSVHRLSPEGSSR